MDRMQAAMELRRALQLYVQSLTDESTMMEVASVYPEWKPNRNYKVGEIFQHGLNAEGEVQLYRIVKDHTSQADWLPSDVESLYKAIGFTPSGVPIWTQPLGAHDAYKKGDKVQHNDKYWISTVDNNVWEPGVFGWEVTM